MISPNELYERLVKAYEKPDCSQGCTNCKFDGGYKPTAGGKCYLTAIEYALKIKG